jgi:hypothetical protein
MASQLAQHDSENSRYSLRIASSEVPRLRMTRHTTERSHMAKNLQNDTWNRASPGLTVGSPDLDNFSHLIAVQGRHEGGNICDRVGIVKAPETIPPVCFPSLSHRCSDRSKLTEPSGPHSCYSLRNIIPWPKYM